MNDGPDNATAPKCPDCGGTSVQFRGSGSNMQFRICPRYREAGHLSEQEIRDVIAEHRMAARPSGRFA